MVAGAGTQVPFAREQLRCLAIEKGYGVGKILSYTKLAQGMEDRYSPEVLNWLGYPAWSHEKPSEWIRRFLYGKLSDRKSPTLVFLLFVGLFEDSVKSFDEGADRGVFRFSSSQDAQRVQHDFSQCNQAKEESGEDWKCSLSRVLAANAYRLLATAEQLQVSANQVAREALRQHIRIPLTPQSTSGLGPAKLSEICGDLRSGVPQAKVARKFRTSQWTILMILLDSPGLYESHRSAALSWVRDMHRKKILDLMDRESDVSRDTIRIVLPGTYDYVLQADNEWFQTHVPRRKRNPNPQMRIMSDPQELDRMVAARVQKAIDYIRALLRPTQITRTAVLRRAGVLAKFTRVPQKFPSSEALLVRNVETRPEYLQRKIIWAIKEMANAGMSFSVNTLRRRVGLPAEELRTYEQIVIGAAHDAGAEIHGASFFAG